MIQLSWPPRELHPNARAHFHAKARATKAYRLSACYTAMAEGPILEKKVGLICEVHFYPPDRRRRDADGMLSSVKAGIDGIADAYQINDYELNPLIIWRHDPVKGGKVVVKLS